MLQSLINETDRISFHIFISDKKKPYFPINKNRYAAYRVGLVLSPSLNCFMFIKRLFIQFQRKPIASSNFLKLFNVAYKSVYFHVLSVKFSRFN